MPTVARSSASIRRSRSSGFIKTPVTRTRTFVEQKESATAAVEEMLWELQNLDPRPLNFPIPGFEQNLDQPVTAH